MPPTGYVKYDNKVRISLDSVRSKAEIRELKRKLVSELDKVRCLKKKIEASSSSVGGGGEIQASSRVSTTLARVNSEVSRVGPTNHRPLQPEAGLAATAAGGSVEDTNNRNAGGGRYLGLEKKHKNPKPKKGQRNLEQGGERKRDGGRGEGMGIKSSGSDGFTKKLFSKCKELLDQLMRHQYGWVFNVPVDAKKLKLHDYHKIIKHPMDLGTVKSKLTKHLYKSPKSFAEDVRLTFNNAMTYNEKGQDVHAMADVLLKLFEEKWAAFKKELDYNESNAHYDKSLPKPAKKKAPPALASSQTRTTGSAPSPIPNTIEKRTLDESESMALHTVPKSKAAKSDSNQGKKQALKKHKETVFERRDMSYEEKQRLSIDLQNLPSDKLDGIVQIIRKRKPGLFQQEDEIEVDIESFDSETLWELDRFLTNYKKSLSNNEANAELDLQAREAAGFDIHEHNPASSTAEALREPGTVERIGTPIQGEKHGDNVTQSSSSGSDSASSSSDSQSDSSSGSGSDDGQ